MVLIFGPFFGAVLFELAFGKDLKGSFKSGVGTLVGFLGGAIAKLGNRSYYYRHIHLEGVLGSEKKITIDKLLTKVRSVMYINYDLA